MCGTVVDGLFGIARGHEAVDEARGERIAAADAVHDFQSVVVLGFVDFAVRPAQGAPVVDRGGLDGAQGRGDDLEVRVGLGGFVDHLLVAFDVQFLQVGVVAFDFEAQAGREVFFVADHDIDVLRDFLVDFLRLGLAADGAPHGRTVVEVIGHDGAVFLGGLDGRYDGFTGLFGQGRVNAARMEPADAQFAEDVIKVEILRRHFGNGRVGTVGAADGAADAETPFREVQAVAADAADAIGLAPFDEGRVDTALADEVFHEAADFVVGKSRDGGSPHAEAFAQAAHDVVFTAAFPGTEGTGRTDTAFAGIQAEHDFAQAYGVKTAFFSRSQFQIHIILTPL